MNARPSFVVVSVSGIRDQTTSAEACFLMTDSRKQKARDRSRAFA
jgi:hypothetical protein